MEQNRKIKGLVLELRLMKTEQKGSENNGWRIGKNGKLQVT